jgi:YVTN family beta-propeller protein
MIVVSPSLDHIVTSNVNSGTISIIEQVSQPNGGFGPPPGGSPRSGSAPPGGAPPQAQGPPPGGSRMTWEVTNVRSGNGSEGFDLSPDGKEIWAANARDATVTIIDVVAKKTIQTLPIPVKGANRLKFTPDGRRVLISGLGAGPNAAGIGLVVIDATTRKEVKQLSLGGGAAGILIAPDGSRAYVAVSTSDKVAIIDLKTLEVTGQISAGKQPDGLAWAVRK